MVGFLFYYHEVMGFEAPEKEVRLQAKGRRKYAGKPKAYERQCDEVNPLVPTRYNKTLPLWWGFVVFGLETERNKVSNLYQSEVLNFVYLKSETAFNTKEGG